MGGILVGNKNYTTMKKYIKLYALLAMTLFVGSCEDELDFGRDNNKSTTSATIVSGGEIVFGASAAKKSTRTIYGDPFDSNDDDTEPDKIELKWVVDDCVQIASPQSVGMAGGVAEYKVTGVANSTSDNHPSTATLERTGAAGLQWGNVDEGTPYDFYAVYPSVNQLKKSIPASVADTCGLTADGELRGYLPNTQTVTRSDKTVRDYVFEPNMDYAYMVAKEAYKIPKLDADGNPEDKDADGNPIDASIDLNFSSVVTALKFTIKPGEIGLNNGEISTIRVTDLTLFSASGKELCGAFECDFKTGSYETNNAYSGFSQVAMKLGENGCTLSSGSGSITTTFFLLPIEGGYKTSDGDLKLRIHYYVGDVPQYMTATLGVDIPVSQMTYINKLTMKPLKESVKGSAWFSALNSNIYLSQVSIPVASNVFASSIYFDGYDNLHQQVKKYTDLWDMGVRGFEFVNRRAVTQKYSIIGRPNGYNVDNTNSLANANFVVDENPLEGTGDNFIGGVETFGTAFETLATKLAKNENETLVLVCTYQAVGDGYDPNGYVQQLLNYLDYFVANNTLGFTQDDFIQINSGTTVGNLKGNIAIIIRPGDDDRYESNSTTASITLQSSNKKDWSSNVTLIQDWGTAFDVWDRRYEGVARESTFETLYVIEKAKKRTEPRTMVEDWLCGISSSSTPYTQVSGANNFNDGEEWPTKKEQFNYAHTIKGSDGTAYVQEWARVAGANIGPTYTGARTGYESWGSFSANGYLWAKWPESITDKKKAIDGLFKLSVDEKGKAGENLYINSLSGYYIDESVLNDNNQKVSLLPFRSSFYGNRNTETNAVNQGKGGDHVGLAYDLNKYVYGILSGTGKMQDGSLLAEGPWGLVMMEHIGNTTKGADDKSVALVNLIMMNNFRFPLAQKPVVQGASVQRIPLSDESVDINKNIMVTGE